MRCGPEALTDTAEVRTLLLQAGYSSEVYVCIASDVASMRPARYTTPRPNPGCLLTCLIPYRRVPAAELQQAMEAVMRQREPRREIVKVD